MIELSHVYKVYQNTRHALRDLTFTIEKGEFVFLTGPSGAGKTTLFRMISAFDRVTSGEIQVAGFDLNRLSGAELNQFRRRVGMVFQDYRLLNDRSLFENVALPLQIRNERPQILRKKVEEVLKQVGLWDKADEYPFYLSGGEQQRTAIARAIVHQPPVLIADEPTGNLDPQLAEEIMDLFERVCAQGTTVLIATHDHAMVKRRNKKALHLVAGQLADALFSTELNGGLSERDFLK